MEVLIDKVEKAFVEGNSREMKRVRVYGDSRLNTGDVVSVEIEEAMMWILAGKTVD